MTEERRRIEQLEAAIDAIAPHLVKITGGIPVTTHEFQDACDLVFEAQMFHNPPEQDTDQLSLDWTCAAVQQSDEMYCAPCGLRWDVNDPQPPACQRGTR